jgi:hypothetical protein
MKAYQKTCKFCEYVFNTNKQDEHFCSIQCEIAMLMFTKRCSCDKR